MSWPSIGAFGNIVSAAPVSLSLSRRKARLLRYERVDFLVLEAHARNYHPHTEIPIHKWRKKAGGHCRQDRSGLNCKYVQRLSGSSWKPLDREERQYRHLSSHE